jgi:hypothetical protein
MIILLQARFYALAPNLDGADHPPLPVRRRDALYGETS